MTDLLSAPKSTASSATQTALDVLSNLVADDLRRVNETILQRMDSQVALIPQLAGHLISAGGKRLRPSLTLAAAQLCGYDHRGHNHVYLAACVEFIHTATLLHDDVVDESALRRGDSSANALFGNKPSVLVGDFLFSRAFELMVEVGNLPVLGILSRASAIIAEGEVQQLMTTNNLSTSRQMCLDVIRGKTAVLFAAACRVGAEIAQRPKSEAESLYQYGMNLGLAFQLIDDCLDYRTPQKALGKNVGDDFKEGKVTFPVSVALEQASEEEQVFWKKALEDVEQHPTDFDHAVSLLQQHGALEETERQARAYGAQAQKALHNFAPSPAKTALFDVVEFCLNRSW